MKKFQITRYIKNLRYLILAVTLLGCLLIFAYARKNQHYSAEIIIKYTNEMARQGLAPDGSTINVKDIYSAAVITDVREELGLQQNIDQIRSACSVSPIMSEDEEKRKAAILEEGEEYTESCTVYRVTFQGDATSSPNYVSTVLDSIIDNYFVFYSKKYIDSSVIPNNSLNISADKYDYLNCVEILEDSIDDLLLFLENKAAVYPNFRSASTGYSFADLKSEYSYIKNDTIPYYYAIVLGEKLTNDREALLCTYRNRMDQDQIEIENLEDHIQRQYQLILRFGDKVTKSESTVAGAIGDNTDAIIEDVERYQILELDVETTYDDLIDNYVRLRSRRNEAEIDLEYCESVLDVFNAAGVTNSVHTPITDAFVADLNATIQRLNELYEIVELTVDEMNEYNAANNIKCLSGIYAEEAIHIQLYLALAFVLFFVVGCAGAVVIGRAADIWESVIYIDKRAGIANRVKCDMVIEEYAKHLLPDNFACIVFKINNLNAVNDAAGRTAGNAMLKLFGCALEEQAKDYGFVGYNGGNVFLAFFENCSATRMEAFLQAFREKFSFEPGAESVEVLVNAAESSSGRIHEIRKLISHVMAGPFSAWK